MDKKILSQINACKNVRELIILLEDLIKKNKLSRNLTVMIMMKAQTLA